MQNVRPRLAELHDDVSREELTLQLVFEAVAANFVESNAFIEELQKQTNVEQLLQALSKESDERHRQLLKYQIRRSVASEVDECHSLETLASSRSKHEKLFQVDGDVSLLWAFSIVPLFDRRALELTPSRHVLKLQSKIDFLQQRTVELEDLRRAEQERAIKREEALEELAMQSAIYAKKLLQMEQESVAAIQKLEQRCQELQDQLSKKEDRLNVDGGTSFVPPPPPPPPPILSEEEKQRRAKEREERVVKSKEEEAKRQKELEGKMQKQEQQNDLFRAINIRAHKQSGDHVIGAAGACSTCVEKGYY